MLFTLIFLVLIACSDPVSKSSDDSGSNTQSEQGDGQDGSGESESNAGDDNGDGNSNDDGDGSGGDASESPVFNMQNVIINEVMIRQQETLADPDFGAYSGWIELHNRESSQVDLSHWVVGYRPSSYSTAVEYSVQDIRFSVLPEGTTIPANGYLLLWAGGVEHVGEAVHLSLVLPHEGGKIGLYGPESSDMPIADTLSYDALDVVDDISLGRMDFGENHRGFLLPMNDPTPGQVNRLAPLKLLNSFPLDVSDPSGLSVDHTGNYFWTISDDSDGSIYKLDRMGRIVNELKVRGDDMEGITQHPVNRTLYVVEERKREIVQYDTLGNEIARYPVDVDVRSENDGLEGISINPATNHIFVVNEQNPRVLIELDVLRGFDRQEIRKTPMNFGAPEDAGGLDLSGLFFDTEDEVLWMVSDEARAVFVLDIRGRPLAAYHAGQPDLEGIAIIRDENRIFLVSDGHQQLFEYDYPQPLRRLPASE